MTGAVTLAFQTDKTAAGYAALAVAAESFGSDGLSVLNDLGHQPSRYPLPVMAAHTERVRPGVACPDPYLTHPVEIAGQVAALDAASRGRAFFGLSRGAWLDRAGVATDRPQRTMREAVDGVAAVLRADACDGGIFRVPAGFARYPVRRARVDVLVGTGGPRGARPRSWLGIPGALLDRFRFAGTLDDVAEHAHPLFDAGASRGGFGTPHGTTGRHGVELLGRVVLPRLRGVR